jgi:hypothetical protein
VHVPEGPGTAGDIAHLFLKLRIVGQFEFLDPVGLNIETLPNPMHHHARHTQVLGERSHRPLRRVRWPGFERGIQNRFLQLRGERPARPVPRRLGSQRLYPAGAKGCAGGDHRRARQAKLFGDRVIRHAFLGQQNHPAFLGHPLWRCSGADQRFQLRFGGVINGKSSGGRKQGPIESRPAYIVNSYVGRDTRARNFRVRRDTPSCSRLLPPSRTERAEPTYCSARSLKLSR